MLRSYHMRISWSSCQFWIYAKLTGSTSTVSLIFVDILRLLSKFDIFFCIKIWLLNLIKSLVRYFFLILNNGESTGPKTSSPLIFFNFIFISLAPFKLKLRSFDEIIIATSLMKGGNLFFFSYRKFLF